MLHIFRTRILVSVSKGQRRLGQKEYRAPSVTPGLHFARELSPPRNQVVFARSAAICEALVASER